MVSCNETSKEEELSEDEKSILGVELRKTKEEEGVVIHLNSQPGLLIKNIYKTYDLILA